MAQFPKLKTGAVAQYPAVREQRFSTEVKKFLDSTEQRYRGFAAGKRRWVIALEQLDESEMARLAQFFEQQQGRLGVFAFQDPWSGTIVPQCRFGEDRFPSLEEYESRGSVRVTVEEIV